MQISVLIHVTVNDEFHLSRLQHHIIICIKNKSMCMHLLNAELCYAIISWGIFWCLAKDEHNWSRAWFKSMIGGGGVEYL